MGKRTNTLALVILGGIVVHFLVAALSKKFPDSFRIQQ